MRSAKSFLALIAVLGITAPALAQGGRTQVFASGLFNQSTFSFTDHRTFTLNLEQGAFSGRWSSTTGPAFGFGVTREIWKGVTAGVAVDLVGNTPEESFEAHVPHPFFFNRLRVVAGEANALSYDEKAIHLLLGYSRTVNRWVFVVTGGPSHIRSSTEIVDAFQLNDVYPFDEVTLA